VLHLIIVSHRTYNWGQSVQAQHLHSWQMPPDQAKNVQREL